MRKPIAAVVWTGAVVCTGVLLAAVSLSPSPTAAQGNLWVAAAVSPSKLDYGGTHADTSQAGAESDALIACQQYSGAKDCKIVASVSGGCVGLATTPGSSVAKHYGVGQGPAREGVAATALAECMKESGSECYVVLALCSSDDRRWASPLPLPPGGQQGSVDPKLVGLWKLDVASGIWVWQISANGTYTFHSEALDNTGAHNGTFTASNGKYTLHAINISWDDQGTYTLQSSGVMVGEGKLGKGTWIRIASDPNP